MSFLLFNPSYIVGDDVNDIRGSVLVTQAVPEPPTWAMLLTGFAGIGWVTRRRGARRL